MTTRFATCWLLCLLFLTACAQPDATPTPAPTDPPTSTTVPTESPEPTAEPEPEAVEPTPEPTVEPTAAPTATPEPIVPLVEASPQLVNDAGVLMVDRIVMEAAGWLALFNGDALLLAIEVEAGETRALELMVDPLLLGDDVRVALYAAGQGDFSAETTPPILVNDEPVTAALPVELQITLPQLTGIDQPVLEDGIIRLTSVVALEDGWLVAYADEDGELGDMLGIQWVFAGAQENVPIRIRWRDATPTLHVVMHRDAGESGMFDAEEDSAIQVGDGLISAEFAATYPPDIAIINQPVISGTVIIDRVISDGPGWITISRENEQEQVGNIIGFAPLVDGVNKNIVVEVLLSRVTANLYARLHRDTATVGEFEFPNDDPPALYDEQVFEFPFATDTGNYILSVDQAIEYADGKARIHVPMVVADVNVFAVVRADLEGTPGDVIGHQWLPAGVARDVTVEIDAEQATETLHLVMHIDRDELKVLEYPEGRDFELQRRRAPISAPFTVLDG